MSATEEQRVLVVAPIGRDAQLIGGMLGKQHVACSVCASLVDACREAQRGVGALLVAEEALVTAGRESLSELFRSQPPWSDVPLLVLTSNEARFQTTGRALFDNLGARANILLVERPVRVPVLRSIVGAALRTRMRQYELRDQLQERSRNEERLRQSQKMESIGLLAGGIAHDFNNLLTGILGNASLAIDALPPGSPARRSLHDIVQASERAAHLTRQLLAYAGKGRFVIEALDLSQQVREITSLLQTSIPKTVQIRLELAEGLPCIDADAAQIQQVIMNLVINGAEAIPEDRAGTVLIATGLQDVDEAYIRTTMGGGAALTPGQYVALEVHDNGIGMDQPTMAHVFDPFFTTKFTGRGLGLAAVMGIVQGHKAGLKIYSTPGQGTTFKVLFPASAEQPVPEQAPATSKAALAGSGIILVIDDEEIVRRTAKAALEKFGYTVLIAEDGPKGIEMFQKVKDEVRVVLLDMSMPVMSGEETFRRLRIIKPDVKVILSSGYNEVEAIRRFTGKGLAGFLQKPYTSARLGERIKSAIGT